MWRLVRWLIKVVLVLGVCLLTLGSIAYYLLDDYKSTAVVRYQAEDSPTIVIERGSSWRKITTALQAQGHIENADRLYYYGRFFGDLSGLKAGEFALEGAYSPNELIDLFSSNAVIQYRITLIEGWSIKQVLAAVAANPDLRHELQADNPASLALELGLSEGSAEGLFLPETYSFDRGTSDRDLLLRAHADLNRFLAAQWLVRDQDTPLKSPYEALTLASIIEKETGVASEREKVAGVFTLRLKKGMLLQTDPTVIYGMGDAYKGNIRRKDLRKDTPYNTYTRSGLPPTPIALAGKASIKAALNPIEQGYLYFMAAPNVGHTFSKNLKQHNRAVAKYLRWQRSQ